MYTLAHKYIFFSIILIWVIPTVTVSTGKINSDFSNIIMIQTLIRFLVFQASSSIRFSIFTEYVHFYIEKVSWKKCWKHAVTVALFLIISTQQFFHFIFALHKLQHFVTVFSKSYIWCRTYNYYFQNLSKHLLILENHLSLLF